MSPFHIVSPFIDWSALVGSFVLVWVLLWLGLLLLHLVDQSLRSSYLPMTSLAQFRDCHSCYDERSIDQKKKAIHLGQFTAISLAENVTTVSFPPIKVVIVTQGLKSITIPDGVNVAPVNDNIAMPGGISPCTYLAKSKVVQAYGAACAPVSPTPM